MSGTVNADFEKLFGYTNEEIQEQIETRTPYSFLQ